MASRVGINVKFTQKGGVDDNVDVEAEIYSNFITKNVKFCYKSCESIILIQYIANYIITKVSIHLFIL